MYTIRPFEASDAEYASVVAVRRATWPDSMLTVDVLQHNDLMRNAQAQYQRFVVIDDHGQLIAEGSLWLHYNVKEPGVYGITWVAHPDHDSDTIHKLFYTQLTAELAKREPLARRINTAAREDQMARIEFLEQQGFTAAMRSPISQLNVVNYDFAPFAGVTERMMQQGIRIRTLAELMESDLAWKEKLYALATAIMADVPSTDEQEPMSKEDFEKGFIHPRFHADAWFIASKEDEYVGLSFLWVNADQLDKVETGLTGTLRPYRRSGIATALKLRAIEYAQQVGARVIETGNEEHNPMYQLNLRLGFQPIPAWVDYTKVLAAQVGDAEAESSEERQDAR